MTGTAESVRLQEARSGVAWRRWGPYLSERQWGTVREDYSDNGDAWNYLLVSTQRPQRVNELVVSQCDNLELMRMNAAGDLAYLGDTLSFAPRPLLERAMEFRQGESLIAGKIASHATFVRFGPRIAEEGGSDVPADWATGGR